MAHTAHTEVVEQAEWHSPTRPQALRDWIPTGAALWASS